MERSRVINVIVHKDSHAADVLKSFVHALVMANAMGKSKSLHLDSQKWMDNQYEVFMQKVFCLLISIENLIYPLMGILIF